MAKDNKKIVDDVSLELRGLIQKNIHELDSDSLIDVLADICGETAFLMCLTNKELMDKITSKLEAIDAKRYGDGSVKIITEFNTQ